MTRTLIISSLLGICFLLLHSCKETASPPEQAQPKPFEISLTEASEVANAITPQADSGFQHNAHKNNVTGEMIDSRTIRDSVSGEPLIYMIKKPRGFAFVSADLRVMPVLAYSDRSSIDLDDMPNGLKLWLAQAKQKIVIAKRDTSPPHPIVLKEWQKYLSRNLRVEDSNCIEWYQYGQFMCKPTIYQKGPLLTTTWGQKKLSTTKLSTAGDCDGCGRRLAGCGPVAMAQLDEFYHPNPARPRLSVGKCTATTAGETDLGVLMQSMGTWAGAKYNYMGTCNTFTWPSDVKNGLKNYGYSNGGSGNEAYNYSLIKSELNGSHPVIFWGSTCLDCFSDYHVWVCDGYKDNNYSEFNCATKQCNTWSYSYLHMNWGWIKETGENPNGFFAFGQYNPNGEDYNGNLHVITGIRP